MAIYMKFGKVDGSTTTTDHTKWIEVQSFQWAVQRSVSSGAGGNMRESSAPSISGITVTKLLDAASPKLYQDAVAGTFDTKVEFEMTTTSKDKVETFLAFELADCGVSSYSMSSHGDRPIEHLEFTFEKIIYKPSPLDKSGKVQKGAMVSYDLLKMKAS